MSENNEGDDNEIPVEPVENVLPEDVTAVRQALSTIDGTEFAENNEEVYLSVRYPSDREETVRAILNRLSMKRAFEVDEMKTKETGMSALRVYQRASE